jgi:rfaE bifunctional protein nucleotidyltransferase chain/domain
MSKIIKSNNVRSFCDELRLKGKKIVFTNGCFDILHAGHVDYMEKAKKLGHILFVGVNSDDSIKRIKGPSRPIVDQNFRVRALCGLESVDHVCVFDQDTPEELINLVKPDVLVKGMDWKGKTIVGQKIVESYGGRVELIEFLDGISSSTIIEKILNNYGKK